jgi:hypothetical protein
VVRYTNPEIYQAVEGSISTLSTMIPPTTHSGMTDWVVEKQNTFLTHYVTAYLSLCFATGKDITKYHGPKWIDPHHEESLP